MRCAWTLTLGLLFGVTACDRTQSGNEDGGPTDAGVEDAGQAFDAGIDAGNPMGGDRPCIYDAGYAESICCAPQTRRPLPSTVKTTVDLSNAASISAGTCGTYRLPMFPYRQGYALPNNPDAYPLKVILPAITAADAACASICTEEPYTAFGIALQTEGLIGDITGRALSIIVPAPWKFVSGGCGEACTWPCIGGYQEFGVRSCTHFAHGDFGFATTDSNAPSVEALIEVVPLPASFIGPGKFGEFNCCLY